MPETIPQTIQPVSSIESSDKYNGVPIDLFRKFNIPIDSVSGREINQMRDIMDWGKSNNPSDPITVIDKLHRQLGSPGGNERSYDKLWRFIKLNKVINELR